MCINRYSFAPSLTVECHQRGIEFRPAVAKQPPASPMRANVVEIKGGCQDGLLVLRFRHQGTPGIGDEGSTIEAQRTAFADLAADPVAGDQGHHIGTGMSLHHALPMISA